MRALRHREVKSTAQSHSEEKVKPRFELEFLRCQSNHSYPCSLLPHSCPLFLSPIT